MALSDLYGVCVCFLYRGRVCRSGVYPPQQSASWYDRNRLLDVGHVVCVIVLCSVQLLLERILFIVTAVTLKRSNQNVQGQSH